MISPNTGALISAIHRSVSGTTSWIRCTKVISGISSDTQANSPPPVIARIEA